ncbi:MAG: serine hydrolase [Bacteroidales bacterium]
MIKMLMLFVGLFQFIQNSWTDQLEKQLVSIEDKMDGELGVYVKNLADGQELKFNSDEHWYFASTIKIPLGIAILQKVEAGEISLDDELTLRKTDFVDGSGDLIRQNPGKKYTIRELLIKMIKNSDSTATDMLIRLLGEEEFNEQIREHMVSKGINQITSIMQVRYDAYSEIHDNIENLSNMDIVRANSTDTRTERYNTLLEMMKIDRNDAKVGSIEEAFERYYRRDLNSGKAEAMGIILQRLYKGELLNKEHTDFLLDVMKGVTTGDRRIKAGLPQGTEFAQKTGTQIGRTCNMGIIIPDGKPEEAIIVVTRAKGYNSLSDAEKALEDVGKLLSIRFLE